MLPEALWRQARAEKPAESPGLAAFCDVAPRRGLPLTESTPMTTLTASAPGFDRRTQDIGNIVEFGHLNVRVPDQQQALVFYIMGLGLTRDPYLRIGTDNAWANCGQQQFHLPVGAPQILRGTTGLVLLDLDALCQRLAKVAPLLAGTQFSFDRASATQVDVRCPWGSRIRVHAPDEARFGRLLLGMPYIEIDVARGGSEGIARFYRELLGSRASTGSDERGAYARAEVGLGEALVYRECDAALPAYDGHHVQITVADFSGVHGRLLARGLITEESNASQYRFQDLIDPQDGRLLATLEHEVRSMRHPMYARPLVNRNPANTDTAYAAGHEAGHWRFPPRS